MKKKVIFGLLMIALIIAFLSSGVKATNESGIMPINESEVVIPYVPIVNDNVFSLQENINIGAEIVNGNLYLCGNNVSIENATVNGDIFICANNLNISERTSINGNAYICADNTIISGKIERTIYAVSKDIVFEKTSSIGYETFLMADHIFADGKFYRNFDAGVNKFEIGENALIAENLNYTSEVEATIDEKAEVKNINFSRQVEEKESVLDVVANYVLDFVQYLVLTMILFIIFVKLTPKFLQNIDKCFGVSAFGIGILSLIIIPIVSLLMIAISVGSTVSFALLALFLFILLIARAVTSITIASVIAKKSKKIKLPILVALVTLISWILMKIPFIGAIIWFFMLTTGLGISIKYQFIKK